MVKPTIDEKQEYLMYDSEDAFYTNLESGIHELEGITKKQFECDELICGGMAAFDKGLINFINKYSDIKANSGIKVMLLSEVTAEFRRYTSMKVKVPYLCTPHLLAKEIVVLGLKITVTQEILSVIYKDSFLTSMVDLMKKRHPQTGDGYCEAWVYYALIYIKTLINVINPKKVILWNEFYAFHRIFKEVCIRNKIAVRYMEFGCLPGTLSIEKNGQMGESIIAQQCWLAKHYRVTPKECKKTVDIIAYLKRSKLNRNLQPLTYFNKKMIYTYIPNQPLLLYFGQNDYESGLYPYTKISREKHSPVFRSTVEVVEYLSILAMKNRWNLVYKPHPIMENLNLDVSGRNCIEEKYLVKNVDINSLIDNANVIITILSQCAYISLIRDKPVVMLGYNQLRGKHCTYEAFKKNIIEKKINMALKFGFTSKQRRNFIKHCTILNKYYLYDDLVKKEMIIGRDIRQETDGNI